MSFAARPRNRFEACVGRFGRAGRAFVERQLAQSWAGPALICLALLLTLLALAGRTVNAPFLYAPPR